MERLGELIANVDADQQGELYSHLARLDLQDEELDAFIRVLLPKLFKRIDDGLVHKAIAYLGLLANSQSRILSAFIEFDINQPLDVRNGLSLFAHCYYKKRNWFASIFADSNNALLRYFDTHLQNLIRILRIIQLTNSPLIQLDEVERLLALVDTSNVGDDFLQFYLNETAYILRTIDYCKNAVSPSAIDKSQLYASINNSRLLAVFDDFLPLDDEQQWEQMLEMLRVEERRFDANCESELAANDVHEFQSFVILAYMIKALTQCKQDDFVTRASAVLAQVNPKLQVHILEDVFTLCFLQWRHLLHVEDAGNLGPFVCDNEHLQMLLNLVAYYLDALKAQIPIRSVEAARLQDLERHVKDALWRLKMLDDLPSFDVTHMLADADTLIQISLKAGCFDKAHQVIQIFDLHETELAQDIIYTEKLNELRFALSQSFTLQELQKQLEKLGQPSIEKPPQKILNFFAKDNSSASLDDVVDIVFTLNTHPDNTKQLLAIAKNHTPTQFHTNIQDLFFHLAGASMADILLTPGYRFTLEAHSERAQFLRDIEAGMNAFSSFLEDKSSLPLMLNKTYAELMHLAGSGDCNYFNRLINYLKVFLRAFTIESNNVDLIARGNFISCFDLMQLPRSQWLRKLLLERNGDPRDFEPLFRQLKLDLLCCTATCCFPDIRISNRGALSEPPTLRPPSQDVFSYIAKRNWLLAFIVNALFNLMQMDVSATRTKFFTQYVDTPEMMHLMALYGGNRVAAALQRDHCERCVEFLSRNVFESDVYVDMVEAAEEVSEDDSKCDCQHLLALIESVPEIQAGEEIDAMRDKILGNLVEDAYESDSHKYVRLIKNNSKRRQLILDNFSQWPGDVCVSLLREEADPDLVRWAQRVEFCDDIRTLFDTPSWFEMHTLCLEHPCDVRARLLQVPKASLLLGFEAHFGGERLPDVSLEYVASLLRCNEDLRKIEKVLKGVTYPGALCLDLVLVVRDLGQLDFLIDLMSAKKLADEHFIKNVRTASRMLRLFPSQELEHLWSLIKTPLAIIEMLIMNTRLDRLGSVLDAIRGDLENCEFSDHVISLEAIDDLLRKYAEKSLEFRVILNPHPSLLKGSDGKLMQSLDSIYGPDRKCFQMPAKTPPRSEWVPNNEVLECMCCQNIIFSMFNRRHHCRRCGRIICFNCSTKRMQVPTYGDILVRVCLDCYDQSQADSRSDSVSAKSVIYDQWFLSDSNEHNAIVRQEFSYEHAPSVSLCLSIMKYHTKSHLYPKFLLDQCDAMLTLLQPPTHNAPQEVDHLLVITMLKSLAIAAKMLSSDCQLSWGTSQADRILSQADLLALLAERGCLNLLPPSSTGAPYVDAIILRKLRDKLLMQEQWHFALDISTKAGLDNAGVFAAWGKSCLKAGCLQLAREKFRRCLDKTAHHDVFGLEDDSMDASFRSKLSRGSLSADSKPAKNPPILDQIIEILESQRISLPNCSITEMDSAILIKAKLRNLNALANGEIEHRIDFNGCALHPIYFQECLYYLKRYGSHLGLLQFYLQHNCIKHCLMYIFENKVHADIFIEVYTVCLRDSKIDKLLKGMSSFDSTLEIWKEYLRAICRHLEKQGLLNSLYQLQQFMVDFVRASMTCIRFYKDNSTSYQELASKAHFLQKAEAHLLEELEQQQWVEVNAVANSVSSDNGYEEKIALSNPSLVMKMDSKAIDQHIRTIRRQNQLANFLAQHEKSDVQIMQILPFITPNIEGEHHQGHCKQLPTLFDSHNEKVQLAILLIICGETIQDGYDLAYSLIEDYKLKALRVYCQAGRQLAREDRYNEIAELVSCIRSKGSNDPAVTNVCDEMLMLAVRTLSRNDASTTQLEVLIKLITDRATKISIYIETKQLKSAYLLAAKYNRVGDIRRILREADLLNKHDIKKLCQKLLHLHSHSKD